MKTVIFVLLALSAYAFTEQMMSLEELANFNVKTMDCSRADQFSFIEKQMKQWEDLMVHHQAISHDIKILKQMEKMLSSKHHSFLEAQVHVSGKALLKKLHKLELPLTKSQIGLSQVKVLKEQCHTLDSENHEDRAAAKKELCRLLREYIGSLHNCQRQCSNSPITVIKIKGDIKDLEIIRGGCSSNGSQTGVKVTHADDENHEITIHHHHGKGAVEAKEHKEEAHETAADASEDAAADSDADASEEAAEGSDSGASEGAAEGEGAGEGEGAAGEETAEETVEVAAEETAAEETAAEETAAEETAAEETAAEETAAEETAGEETTTVETTTEETAGEETTTVETTTEETETGEEVTEETIVTEETVETEEIVVEGNGDGDGGDE